MKFIRIFPDICAMIRCRRGAPPGTLRWEEPQRPCLPFQLTSLLDKSVFLLVGFRWLARGFAGCAGERALSALRMALSAVVPRAARPAKARPLPCRVRRAGASASSFWASPACACPVGDQHGSLVLHADHHELRPRSWPCVETTTRPGSSGFAFTAWVPPSARRPGYVSSSACPFSLTAMVCS
jgi:hypothetical protein